ncbi:hypothetical protein V1477_000673 [Vespula maculifrons]|uniref:Uncharacterized protein n=1 Tax=Vespula maculifrons TaxID=7453 RepID=A0ABD2D296_VESMC
MQHAAALSIINMKMRKTKLQKLALPGKIGRYLIYTDSIISEIVCSRKPRNRSTFRRNSTCIPITSSAVIRAFDPARNVNERKKGEYVFTLCGGENILSYHSNGPQYFIIADYRRFPQIFHELFGIL